MFEFKPAQRENAYLLIGLAGASGAGKTKSALELATGLAGKDGKIVFLDTEARRALHYAPGPGETADPSKGTYTFHHEDLLPPFTPSKFSAEIGRFEGADVIIIDSMSHEYDGEGGIFDWANELGEKIKGPAAWKEPKLAHKKMMNAFLQARCHLIFCLRAEEKIEILKENGKTIVKSAGWVPICEKRFMFEMTISFTLRPDDPGKPQYDLPHKIQDQHRPIFPAGKYIDVASGTALAAWARGGAPQRVAERTPIDEYAFELQGKLRLSPSELRQWWDATRQYRASLEIPADRLGKMEAAVKQRLAT